MRKKLIPATLTASILLTVTVFMSACQKPQEPVAKKPQPEGALAKELDEMRESMKAKVPLDAKAVMKKANQDLIDSGILDTALKVGDTAPDFTLSDATGQPVHLENELKNGPVVITFYRGKWCPYCNTALVALAETTPAINGAGARVLAVSPQTPDNSLSTQEKHDLPYRVLSDPGNQTANDFGIVFTLAKDLVPIYKKFGIDLADVNGEDSNQLPLPATYVIDTNGKITWAFVDTDYTRRAEPAEVLAAVEALTTSPH
ncbi:MAG: AhpC/TSA family protein [Vampirovibrio sp.]|nr:AhpC/TSA family protein [Vampirovibrio sp.]